MELLGQCYGGWVKVQPRDSVMPGWMWGAALRPVELAAPQQTPGAVTPAEPAPTNATSTAAGAGPGDGAGPAAETSTTQPAEQAVTLEALEPLPLAPAQTARPVASTLEVQVCVAAAEDARACGAPLSGLHVELLLAATEQVQVVGTTDAEGRVALSTSVAAGTHLLLRIGALGLETPIPDSATALPIRVPRLNGASQ